MSSVDSENRMKHKKTLREQIQRFLVWQNEVHMLTAALQTVNIACSNSIPHT